MLSIVKRAMTVAGLGQFIARAISKGYVRESFHSDVERADRNISDEDIHYGLSRKDWTLEGPPTESRTGGFKYMIRTVDIEQVELHLLVKPDPATGNLKILTKY